MNNNGLDLTEELGRQKLTELTNRSFVRVLLRRSRCGGDRSEYIITHKVGALDFLKQKFNSGDSISFAPVSIDPGSFCFVGIDLLKRIWATFNLKEGINLGISHESSIYYLYDDIELSTLKECEGFLSIIAPIEDVKIWDHPYFHFYIGAESGGY